MGPGGDECSLRTTAGGLGRFIMTQSSVRRPPQGPQPAQGRAVPLREDATPLHPTPAQSDPPPFTAMLLSAWCSALL